jgi:Cft2 family RNA processing exonuclease
MAENEGDTTFKASVETVKETIRSQLDTANRFTSQNNEAFSTLTATFFAVTAAQAGHDAGSALCQVSAAGGG